MTQPIYPPFPRVFEVKTLNFNAIQLRDLCFIYQKAPAQKRFERKDSFEATIS